MTAIHDPKARLEAARLIVARGCDCDAQENCGRDPNAYCGCRKEAEEILGLVPVGRWSAALSEVQAIRQCAEAVLEDAKASDAPDRRELGAINWGDLGVIEISHCQQYEYGTSTWRVLIEEASPDCALRELVYVALKQAFPDKEFDVATEW